MRLCVFTVSGSDAVRCSALSSDSGGLRSTASRGLCRTEEGRALEAVCESEDRGSAVWGKF